LVISICLVFFADRHEDLLDFPLRQRRDAAGYVDARKQVRGDLGIELAGEQLAGDGGERGIALTLRDGAGQ
jgi:hypothetical protein